MAQKYIPNDKGATSKHNIYSYINIGVRSY